MKKFFLVVLSLSIFLSVSAQNETAYEVDAFHTIDVQHNFKVYLSQGNEYTVTAHVPEGYGEFMIIEVRSGVLHLAMKGKKVKTKNSWTWRDKTVTIHEDGYENSDNGPSKIEIYVTFPSIDALEVGGVSEIIGLTPLELQNFKLNTSGASKVALEMNANDVDLDQSGASKAELNITANHLFINLSGSSKNYLQLNQPVNSIDADLSGASYIEIVGNADAIIVDISGASEINAPTLNVSKVMAECSGAAKLLVGKVEKMMVDGSGASSVKYQESETKTEIDFQGSGAASLKAY